MSRGMDHDWHDITVFGSIYQEQQCAVTGAYRHRRVFPGTNAVTLWAPGRAPTAYGVVGAATPEQAEALRINPMRMLSRLRCEGCGHTWQQPAATGACPRCHSDRTACYDQEPCMAPKA